MKGIAAGEAPQTFMAGGRLNLAGIDCPVTRSGYTGEDGFEISVPAAQCEALAKVCSRNQMCNQPASAPAIAAPEAGPALWPRLDTNDHAGRSLAQLAMQKVRRTGGERAGGFPARRDPRSTDDATKVKRKRVGLKPGRPRADP